MAYLCWAINYSPQLCLIIQITATTVCTLEGKHPPSPSIILIPNKLHISSLETPQASSLPNCDKMEALLCFAMTLHHGNGTGRKLLEQRQEGIWHYLFPRERDETTWEWDKRERKLKSIIF